jgi:hypothetical protein
MIRPIAKRHTKNQKKMGIGAKKLASAFIIVQIQKT